MLTDAQMVNVRRWAGYPLTGTSMPITDDQDIVYARFGLTWMSLHKRLATLSAAEEEILITQYLTPLASLEAALLGASDNLDTKSAGPFVQDEREVAKRTGLYNKWRRDMAGFLGFPPGPSLGAGGMQIVRC